MMTALMNNFINFFIHVRQSFWSESFWLPLGIKWTDLQRTSDVFIPDVRDLWIVAPMAVGLFFARIFWERHIALPLGQYYRLKDFPSTFASPNSVLEKAFCKHGKTQPSHTNLLILARDAGLTQRQVERWWHRRRTQGKASEMQRFKETSWRFSFYFLSFWSGIGILWDKPWFSDTKHCWYGYPRQHVSNDIWWYFMIELAFYLSLIISLFMDIKRKDFMEMIVHHVVTISLMTLAWTNNMVRIGTLVLCVHDAVDYWLEGAKLANYCAYRKLTDFMFVVFTIVWFITRLVIYPFWVINSTMFEFPLIIEMFPMYYLYNALLCILQVLHIIWFTMILRMVFAYVIKGKVEKDERSETECDSETSDDELVRNVATNLNEIHRNN